MKYGELSHFSHPQHQLLFEYSELPFKCDGCREVGIGSRFKCSIAISTSTKQCAAAATATAPVLRHPFYRKCFFHFPPARRATPRATATLAGATSPASSTTAAPAASTSTPAAPPCRTCWRQTAGSACTSTAGRRRLCHPAGGRGGAGATGPSCKKYNLHVACVTEMLVDSWHELYYGGGGHHRSVKGRLKRCCEVAAMAVQFVISAVLGDPTPLSPELLHRSSLDEGENRENRGSLELCTAIYRVLAVIKMMWSTEKELSKFPVYIPKIY
ncbi:hypothetical protein AXF42_Ash020445 [Apostasia shenzhenica]|uniref:Uncharacterized protein n=1 Tax=Apostasia shenzhenica TaxID=1088818 RepID=A0A2H9ZYJ4_9ASPA|nr:hypothetical protein AXF42_Ash020445 [Apostasia shenzhenica]